MFLFTIETLAGTYLAIVAVLLTIGLIWHIVSDALTKKIDNHTRKVIKDQREQIVQLKHENLQYKRKYGPIE